VAKTNVTDEMEARVAESNAWGADLHVAIHTNAFNGQVQGTRIFSYDTSGEGYKACKAVMATLAPITPGESDNIKAWPGLYEVGHSDAPTVYIEVAFHDNKEEATWIIDNTEQIGEAICKGICNYYGISYVEKQDLKPIQDIEKKVYNTLDEVPGYAKATIQKLLEKDLLVGTSAGLKLSEDMIRVFTINDRAGLYD
jgi:glutamine amidotransferase-like uncharacterized protein